MSRNVANWFHQRSFIFSPDEFYIFIASILLMDEAIRFILIDYFHKYCYIILFTKGNISRKDQMVFSERQEVDDLTSAALSLGNDSNLIRLFSSYDDTTVSTCPRTVGNLHGTVVLQLPRSLIVIITIGWVGDSSNQPISHLNSSANPSKWHRSSFKKPSNCWKNVKVADE